MHRNGTSTVSTEEAAAFKRLLQHIEYAPTITLGRGVNAKVIKRMVDGDVVYALTEAPQGPATDGVQRFTLWVAPVKNGAPTERGAYERLLLGMARGKRTGIKESGRRKPWTPAMRAEHSKRMTKAWAQRRSPAASTVA